MCAVDRLALCPLLFLAAACGAQPLSAWNAVQVTWFDRPNATIERVLFHLASFETETDPDVLFSGGLIEDSDSCDQVVTVEAAINGRPMDVTSGGRVPFDFSSCLLPAGTVLFPATPGLDAEFIIRDGSHDARVTVIAFFGDAQVTMDAGEGPLSAGAALRFHVEPFRSGALEAVLDGIVSDDLVLEIADTSADTIYRLPDSTLPGVHSLHVRGEDAPRIDVCEGFELCSVLPRPISASFDLIVQ